MDLGLNQGVGQFQDVIRMVVDENVRGEISKTKGPEQS